MEQMLVVLGAHSKWLKLLPGPTSSERTVGVIANAVCPVHTARMLAQRQRMAIHKPALSQDAFPFPLLSPPLHIHYCHSFIPISLFSFHACTTAIFPGHHSHFHCLHTSFIPYSLHFLTPHIHLNILVSAIAKLLLLLSGFTGHVSDPYTIACLTMVLYNLILRSHQNPDNTLPNVSILTVLYVLPSQVLPCR